MSNQVLRPNGAIDILTKQELMDSLGHHFDLAVREQYRGVKLFRIPMVVNTAGTAAFTLAAAVGSNPPGPDQGYIWRLTRIMVASSSLVDVAKYVLYVGSDTTATEQRHLIDAIVGGATPGQNVNVAFRPGNKSEWLFPGEQIYAGISGATVGNVYSLTGIAVEVPSEMVGKIA
jgi:hypothetical protein